MELKALIGKNDGMSDMTSCRVWLSIIDSDMDPMTIGSMLHMTPTSVYSVGSEAPTSRNAGSRNLSQVNRWEMKIGIADENSLNDHLKIIENSFSDDVVRALNAISLSSTVVFEFEIQNESGISLSDEFIRLAANCGASIDIDVIASA